LLYYNEYEYEYGSHNDLQELGYDDMEQTRVAYGSRVLGGFIGDNAYILAQLHAKAETLEAEADRLIELGDPQKCYLFARYCFSEKDNHIYRTTNPQLVMEFAERINYAKKKILCRESLGAISMLTLFLTGYGPRRVSRSKMVDSV
jgi:hypothetical protein